MARPEGYSCLVFIPSPTPRGNNTLIQSQSLEVNPRLWTGLVYLDILFPCPDSCQQTLTASYLSRGSSCFPSPAGRPNSFAKCLLLSLFSDTGFHFGTHNAQRGSTVSLPGHRNPAHKQPSHRVPTQLWRRGHCSHLPRLPLLGVLVLLEPTSSSFKQSWK